MFNQLSWRVSRTIDTGYTVRHPLGWEKRNDSGVLLVLVNIKRVGAQGTDQPTESMVFKPLDKVCESTEWEYEPYFGGFYRVGCVSVNPHIHVEMVAFDVKSQRIEETILRSFK